MKPALQVLVAMAGSAGVLALIFIILWINRDSDRTPGLLVKTVAAPMVVALALVAAEIFAELPRESVAADVIVVRDDTTGLLPLEHALFNVGSPFGEGYRHIQDTVRTWQPRRKPGAVIGAAVEEQREFTLDIVELALLRWLSWHYPTHWDVEVAQTRGIACIEAFGAISDGAESKPLLLSIGDIRGVRENKLLQDGSYDTVLPGFGHLAIPSGSVLEEMRGTGFRELRLRNSELTLTIRFRAGASGNLGASALADRIRHSFPQAVSPLWHEYQIRASLECEYSHLRRWSNRTTRQRRWVGNLMSSFKSDFDWQTLRRDLEVALQSWPPSPRT